MSVSELENHRVWRKLNIFQSIRLTLLAFTFCKGVEKGSGVDKILFKGVEYLVDWMTFKNKEWTFRIRSG